MQAWIGYSFGFILPGQTVGLYLHGFDPEKFWALDLQVTRSDARPGAFNPSASLTVQAVDQHVDGSKAYTLTVANRSTSTGAEPAPVVDLLVFEAELT
jgi:hypothetical protein